MSWLILLTIPLASLSRPDSMQALSKSCLTIRLASSGELFLNSLSFTIISFLRSNSKVMLRRSILGLPAWIEIDLLERFLTWWISWRPFDAWRWRWGWWLKQGPLDLLLRRLPFQRMAEVRSLSIGRKKLHHLRECSPFSQFFLRACSIVCLGLLLPWVLSRHQRFRSQHWRTLGLHILQFRGR